MSIVATVAHLSYCWALVNLYIQCALNCIWRHQATPTYSVQRYAAISWTPWSLVAWTSYKDFFRRGVLSAWGLYRTGEWLWIDSNGKMETRHPVQGLFGKEFSTIYNRFRLIAAWRRKTSKHFCKKYVFFSLKTTPYGNFLNSVPKGFIVTPIYVLCLNFVKFGRREIGKVVRYLPDKKRNFDSLSRSHYCANRDQNLPGPAPDNVLRAHQVSSKLVHFRLSYSRSHEHRKECFQYSAEA